MAMRAAQKLVFCLLASIIVYQIECRGLSELWSIIDEDLLNSSSTTTTNDPLTYLWPMPKQSTNGNVTITVDPNLQLDMQGNSSNSSLVQDAFARYKGIILRHHAKYSNLHRAYQVKYAIGRLIISVSSADETLQLGTDESYSLYVPEGSGLSIIQDAVLEAKTVYGALRGLETFSQLCTFNFTTKNVEIYNAPWFIQDEPRFAFRGLLIDTSRHYQPVEMIKQIIESMSYSKLNVLHWHIIDEESFPLEVPSYPNLWKGSYTGWERYTVDDAHEIVEFAKTRGINIMAEIDVPGHSESWGVGYPDLWPSMDCREPLDVSKNFTFEVISSILSDLRKIFPFELFHMGGDEVHSDCWIGTPKVKKWLDERNMTAHDAYQYFVLRAQELAIRQGWTPINWEETFNAFSEKLNPHTIVHNWLGPGVCNSTAMAETLVLRGTMKGHSDVVTSIATPIDNSDMIVSASRDKSILLWHLTREDPAYGVPRRRLTGHSHFVQDVVISSDGQFALSGSWDSELRLWDLNTGLTTRRFVGHSKDVLSVAFSIDNRQIVSASRDRTIKLWNTLGECKYTIQADADGHSNWISCVRFSPSAANPTIVSSSWDRTVKVWNLTNCKLRNTLAGHSGYVNTVAVSPDGSLCASGGKDGVTMLWDLAEGKRLYSLDAGDIIHSLCFSPNRYWLCAATQQCIKIWDLESKSIVEELRPDFIPTKKAQIPYCTSLSWSADGSTLFSGYTDGNIRVWGVGHF